MNQQVIDSLCEAMRQWKRENPEPSPRESGQQWLAEIKRRKSDEPCPENAHTAWCDSYYPRWDAVAVLLDLATGKPDRNWIGMVKRLQDETDDMLRRAGLTWDQVTTKRRPGVQADLFR